MRSFARAARGAAADPMLHTLALAAAVKLALVPLLDLINFFLAGDAW